MVAKTDRRQDDDANPFDERGVLKDHRSYRVPMYAMDALSRDVAQHFAGVTDATGDGGLGLHKPGFRISNTITRDRSIYDAYDAAAEVAYKNVDAVESEVRGQREGDSCTVKSDQGLYGAEGSPGHLQMAEGELVCVADSKLSDALRDDREAAYQEYQDRIQNAWRTG
jgi:hypothetical protein